MRKKLLSLVLALVMMLSMGTVAMAEEPPASSVGSYSITNAAALGNTVTMKKAYTIVNKGTVSPAETFVFTSEQDKKVHVSACENVGVDAYENNELKDYPIIISDAVFEAVTAAGNNNVTEKNITITLPAYEAVGKYTYVFSEVAGSTAGVIYDNHQYKVEVIVTDTASTGNGKALAATVNVFDATNNNAKSDTISNTYRAGSLSVAKKVSGNMADKNKYFDVTVTFTKPEDVTVNEDITYDIASCGSYDENGDGADYVGVAVATDAWAENTATVTIKLKDNDTVKFNNIPYGVKYAVKEADYTAVENGGYAAAKYTGTKITSETTDSPTNIEIDDAEQIVNIENNKEVNVETGINLDSMPYILILVAVAVGGVVIVSKKRKEEF